MIDQDNRHRAPQAQGWRLRISADIVQPVRVLADPNSGTSLTLLAAGLVSVVRLPHPALRHPHMGAPSALRANVRQG